MRNGAPFTELAEAFKRLQQHLLHKPGSDREMVEILSLILQHDEQVVLTAVEMAPQALSLVKEPKADVERCAKPGRCVIRHDPSSGAIPILSRLLKAEIAEWPAAGFSDL